MTVELCVLPQGFAYKPKNMQTVKRHDENGKRCNSGRGERELDLRLEYQKRETYSEATCVFGIVSALSSIGTVLETGFHCRGTGTCVIESYKCGGSFSRRDDPRCCSRHILIFGIC